jgi:hypothetical protein
MGKQIVEGKVDKVYAKALPEPDQYGNAYGLSMNVNGQWYGLGRKKKDVVNVKQGQGWHRLAEGDVIEAVCDVVQKGDRTYYNVRTSDITVKEASNGAGSGSNSNSGGGVPVSGAGSTPKVSQDDRQDAIMRQSAMGYAAQIVAGTLTGKSDLDKAATEVVRIANEYLMPYAKHGLTEDDTRKQQEKEVQNQQAQQQAEDDKDFDDSIPF